MKIIEPSFEILYPVTNDEWIREFKLIELAGRTAYKSENKINENFYLEFIGKIKKLNHGAVFEFGNMVVKFITDRGITHEIVRHRLCSFLQESTRYCNYSDEKFGKEITVIKPFGIEEGSLLEHLPWRLWKSACEKAEKNYLYLLQEGASPQMARSVLPTCTKTEIIVKANFREWQHIFNLRVLGKAGNPHPDMVKLMKPLYEKLKSEYPFLWDAETVE